MAWVDDDGTAIEDALERSDPDALRCPSCRVMPGQRHKPDCTLIRDLDDDEHARDLEEAGRVAGLDLRAHDAAAFQQALDREATAMHEDLRRYEEANGPIGDDEAAEARAVTEAIMAAVREAVLPLARELRELSERLDLIEEYVDMEGDLHERDASVLADPPIDTPDIATLDRPLTPAEDRARAAEIARIAKLDAAETEAADLRGIDQAAPDAPLPPPVEDEVVIPVVGPKGSFR